ncbi:unnamed protein product [Clonostachys byssicola]|uniref:AAA+ ATPase domain-containing protein n=1 Tax=Clonostachys byssicola TaxID=160290 RepID=A0A9N9ULL8_9HYPO|nr:unnamed protein product [Clonostachys byssicola]
MEKRPKPYTSRPSSSPRGSQPERQAKRRRQGDHEDQARENSEEGIAPRSQDAETRTRQNPITTIDWRAQLCRFLGTENSITDDELLEELETAFIDLKKARLPGTDPHDPYIGSRHQIIYRLRCLKSGGRTRLYEELCSSDETVQQGTHLFGRATIKNLELYLERNKDIAMIVYKDFECCGHVNSSFQHDYDQGQLPTSDASPLLKGESIKLVSEEMKRALSDMLALVSTDAPLPKSQDPQVTEMGEDISSPDSSDVDEAVIESEHELEDAVYPYLWWFHHRLEISDIIDMTNEDPVSPILILRDYIISRMSNEWVSVDYMMSQNQITARYLPYLYVPGQIIISKQNGKDISKFRGLQVLETKLNSGKARPRIRVSSWSFDGKFHRVESYFPFPVLHSTTQKIGIRELELYPLRFALEEVVEAIRKRGEMIWKCRHRHYVSSRVTRIEGTQTPEESRFMVDMETYKRMYPEANKPSGASGQDVLDDLVMEQDCPDLGDSFYMCLPANIVVTLEVHHLTDVRWNTKAFDYLVINQETKELIKAVVTNQLGIQSKSDLIQGKGNGLFILLHGGPGTGKTLTAESVAEIAKRPLYRVTCGDIGTKAEDVEQYLDSVLLLGATWGCVVLLDEADVFLEQRSILNLERNALVSVFLRVLEYYDGILILTSNRVGIFDEAFKSRIQLSLHYSNLDKNQRYQIWNNFIHHQHESQDALEVISASSKKPRSSGYGINLQDLTSHLDTLASANLNGREIRNALSTARQLATYREQCLDYSHLEIVMKEAQKFDKYLKEVHHDISEDDIKRGRKER